MKLRSGSAYTYTGYIPKPRNKRGTATTTRPRQLKIRILKRKRKDRVDESLRIIKDLSQELSPDSSSAREREFYSHELETYGVFPEFRMPWEVRVELSNMWDKLLYWPNIEFPSPLELPTLRYTEGFQAHGNTRGMCFSHQDLAGSLMEERACDRYLDEIKEHNRAYDVSKAPSVYSKGYGWRGWKDGGFKVRGKVGVYQRRMAKKILLAQDDQKRTEEVKHSIR